MLLSTDGVFQTSLTSPRSSLFFLLLFPWALSNSGSCSATDEPRGAAKGMFKPMPKHVFLYKPSPPKQHYQGQLAPISSPRGSFLGYFWVTSMGLEAQHHSRSCPARTSRGRAACEAAVPCVPARSTWPAPPGTARATVGTSTALSTALQAVRGEHPRAGVGMGMLYWSCYRSCRAPCSHCVAVVLQDFPFLPLLGLPTSCSQPEDVQCLQHPQNPGLHQGDERNSSQLPSRPKMSACPPNPQNPWGLHLPLPSFPGSG